MNEKIYWLWLCGKVSDRKKLLLYEHFSSAENVFKAGSYDLGFLTDDDKMKLSDKQTDSAEADFEKCERLDIKIITWNSSEYPVQLRHISQPPAVIYAKGTVPAWESMFAIGVVGTRKMTSYGYDVTRKLSAELAGAGAVIVTGFARGNDSEATLVATELGGFSIGVLGGGVDVIYPPENKKLYEKVLEYGLFISEYPPGTPPKPYHFPRRNRLIAGICDGVLVTEAPVKSGAIITAHIAADEGKSVFAVPGQIYAPSSAGTNRLIMEGAKPVLSGSDILSEFPYFESRKTARKSKPERYARVAEPPAQFAVDKTSSKEELIVQALSENGDMSVDMLAAVTGLSVHEINSCCVMLELCGKLLRLPGNIYHLCS